MKHVEIGNIAALCLVSVVFASCLDENVCGGKMVEENDLCIVPKDTDNADLVTANVIIPENFDCTPVLLAASFFDNQERVGTPSAFGEQIFDPKVEPGETVELISSQAGLEGTYYLTVTLYCEGGGDGMGPVAGVDWVSPEVIPVILGPGTETVDVGDVSLVRMR